MELGWRLYHHSCRSRLKRTENRVSTVGVGQLVLTHLSPRYVPGNPVTPKDLLDEAKAIFPNTLLAKDFLSIDVKPRCNSS